MILICRLISITSYYDNNNDNNDDDGNCCQDVALCNQLDVEIESLEYNTRVKKVGVLLIIIIIAFLMGQLSGQFFSIFSGFDSLGCD